MVDIKKPQVQQVQSSTYIKKPHKPKVDSQLRLKPGEEIVTTPGNSYIIPADDDVTTKILRQLGFIPKRDALFPQK